VKQGSSSNQEEKLENLALKLLEKEIHKPVLAKFIVRVSLAKMIPAEQQKVLDYFKDKLLDLLGEKDGIKLCLELVNCAAAKDRKAMLKCFKDRVLSLALEAGGFGYLAICKFI